MRGIPSRLTSSVSVAVTGSDPLSIPAPDLEGAAGVGFAYTASTINLADKRITLGYVPASVDDADVIDAYHGLLNGPSYAASLTPVLRVGGQVVARGDGGVSTGYTQKLRITYRSPGFATKVVENPLAVGSLSALTLDLGEVDVSRLASRGSHLNQEVQAAPDQPVLTDGRIGELFSQLGELYFLQNDRYNEILARGTDVSIQRQVSGAIVATDIDVWYVAGFPVATQLAGASFDVDHDVLSATGLKPASNSIGRFGRSSGAYASSTEASVLEATFGGDAASTTAVIRKAMAEGIPVYMIDNTNVDAALARISAPSSAKAEIRSAVIDQSARVTIPERPVTIGGWTGVAYQIEGGGMSEYRIQGGSNGGSLVAGIATSTAVATAGANVAHAAEHCSEFAEHLAIFSIGSFSLIANLVFALLFPFPANVLFLALWVLELTLWFVELVRLSILMNECDGEIRG
jgi:hypothetical protein